MDKLMRGRRPVRTQLTRIIKEINDQLAVDNPDHKALKINHDVLVKTMEDLDDWDIKVKGQLLDDAATEDVVDDEFKNIEKYRRSFLTTLSDVESKLGHKDDNTTETGSVISQGKKRKFHLPEVKLKTFGGGLKDWLGWWSQYEKIHNDVDLHDTDKFHYLCQGMEPGTEAKELIDSYPHTEENYKKAIEALKERYGRQDLLLQVYVRELLTLVISNVTSKDKLSLSQLYLRLESHLRSLAALNLDKADPATWLYPLVESSLSEETLRAWQRSAQSKIAVEQVPDGGLVKSRLDKLMEFIKMEVQSEQQISLAQQGFQSTSYPTTSKKNKPRPSFPKHQDDVPTAAGLVAIQSESCCGFCGFKNHETQLCFKAQRMTLEERNKKVREKRLCFKCLRPGHQMNKCKIFVKCSICQGPHYQVMCLKLDVERNKRFGGLSNDSPVPPKKRTRSDRSNESIKNKEPSSSAFHQGSNQCARNILLNTLKVKVRHLSGKMMTVRVLCDSGSQRSYALTRTIKNVCCEHLDDEWIQNVLFGGELTVPKKYPRYAVNLMGINGSQMQFQLLEKDRISGNIPEIPLEAWINEFQQQGVTFSDIGKGSSEAEILIGNDYWGAVRTGRMVKLESGLCAEETVFGWVLGGPVNVQASSSMISSCMTVSPQDIKKLWSLEAIGIRDPAEVKSREEEGHEALEHFSNTVQRNKDGRYIVSLPWKKDHRDLPTNRKIAEQRLKSATYKLQKTNQLSKYHAVFKGWEEEGLIHRVLDCDTGHFIPHRPVYKDSTTTPVRPVFDASCKQGRSPSLNECLHKGPNLIELIPALLLRFGAKKIGISADIRKAFQMIMVNKEDQPYQRFLWWEDESCKQMIVYEHKRVVFGVTSSPFLLGATINHHLKNCEDQGMANALLKSFYVDNLVMSVDSEEEYINVRFRANEIMTTAKMELRQWACSVTKSTTDTDFKDEKILPLLGILWNTEDDSLSCAIKQFRIDGEITKRNMLSVVAQVFDPVGYLCPAMILPKMLVQEQWTKKTEWDTPVPAGSRNKFLRWLKGLQHLKEVLIPRHNQIIQPSVREVHIFSDSSQDAMAAVAFMRTELHGEVALQFLMAKSRLTPVNKPTIPRAELISCVIGVRVGNTIREALDLPQSSFIYWSDSSTALAWIRRAGDWAVFVCNRVKEILRTTTSDQWRHVPGTINPADLPSRGCAPLLLLHSKWWEGPAWLQGPRSGFPSSAPIVNEAEVVAETKKTAMMISNIVPAQPKFSSYRKNIAVWGWVFRFVSCLRGKKIDAKFLTIYELRMAEKILLKQIQNDVFSANCTEVGGVQVERDGDGILRVRSRLINRKDKDDFIYPILLPKSHPLVEFLIRDIHQFHGHGGVQFLLSKIREKYWILQSRRVVRKIVRACVKCRRHAVKNLEVEPAALPAKRVSNSEVYSTTGVDLAGPLFLKDSKKAWIVLYTCAVYRCIELDVVTSLSTEAFLGSLERFIGLHGRPNTMYSDNGTNFVGAASLFQQVNWMEVEEQCNLKQIQWVFNPPTAAWWGGFWERMVRSVKDLLKRILGRSKLSLDELRTCLAGVAATINDRPLTVVTEDNMDLIPLTPGMFTRLCGNGHFPELGTAEQLSSSYKKMKELQASLQARFRKEYLSLLVTRVGKKQQEALKKGDVVLVGADNRKRFEWPLGVVLELLPGTDGKVRRARVKTATSELLRPLQRLYPLEVTQQQPQLIKERVEPSEEDETVTKFGRIVKRPVRYGQWLHLIK